MSITCSECGGKYELKHGPYRDTFSKVLVEIDYYFCGDCGSVMLKPDDIHKLEAASRATDMARLQGKHSLLVSRLEKALKMERESR